MDFLNNKQDK